MFPTSLKQSVKHYCQELNKSITLRADTKCPWCGGEIIAPAKQYLIRRTRQSVRVDVHISEEQRTYPLQHVQYHSDHFEYGFGGSGPADLALSVLADYFGEQPTRMQLHAGDALCWKYHQNFKWHFIAPQWRDAFILASQEIAQYLASLPTEGA